MLLSPFKVAKYRKLFINNYIGDFHYDTFDRAPIRMDLLEKIVSIAYSIFIDHYRGRNFQEELLFNEIEVHEFNSSKRFKHDFREDEILKNKLKENLSKLKEEHLVSDEKMNKLLVAIWAGFLKYRIVGVYTELIYHDSIKVTWSKSVTFETNKKENEISDIW
ncbi:hypothetical protein QF117_04240 [Vibrio sp. YMD68]|uniref:hypothetical protein n=1 Tax=Vibrio sp. YMD68 TaxID=3042300 RepID=UPI00249ADFDD|nr:hypothetical protein [Vibrio sp. YMD68]WGV98032.1 hypothetical protein QF117_04015 [Vibrio sp. YMD68]WGV98075.1 hypothetical protein QF117_04240 [Vibrio sp. YMD68]